MLNRSLADSRLSGEPTPSLPPWVSYGVVIIVAWLVMGPRIPLANVAGSSVRLEDVFLAILWLYVLCQWQSISHHLPRRRVVAIAVIGIVATVLAVIAGRVSVGPALLYSIRPLEYWVVFPATYFVLRSGTSESRTFFVRMLGTVTVVQVCVAALQALFGLDLGFSKFSSERGAGLTAGPYELGAICSMLGVYWLMRQNYILAVIAAAGVFLAASRISIIGLAVGALIALFLSRKSGAPQRTTNEKRLLKTSVGLVVLVASLLFIVLNPMSSEQLGGPVVNRLQETSTFDAWNASGTFASGLELPKNSMEYDLVAYGYMPYLLGDGGFASAISGEASDMVRFFRWHILIDLLGDPGTLLFGLGPSFAGASVDGSFLRMIAETGFVGFAVWMIAIRGWARSLEPAMRGALAALLIGAIFIDVLYSLRTMVLLWAMLASSDAAVSLSHVSPPQNKLKK